MPRAVYSALGTAPCTDCILVHLCLCPYADILCRMAHSSSMLHRVCWCNLSAYSRCCSRSVRETPTQATPLSPIPLHPPMSTIHWVLLVRICGWAFGSGARAYAAESNTPADPHDRHATGKRSTPYDVFELRNVAHRQHCAGVGLIFVCPGGGLG